VSFYARRLETVTLIELLLGFRFFNSWGVSISWWRSTRMSTSKRVITREEWEKKLNEVKIRKEDMNKLVMNYLVTEGYVEAAERFKMESGTERILYT
ncbi:hypothetical protein C5167_043059, partial [Papaver somniferum]